MNRYTRYSVAQYDYGDDAEEPVMADVPHVSIWLVPPHDAYEPLAALIKRLSEQYRGLFFEPHVTLLGHIAGAEQTVIDRTEQLANRLNPFTLALSDADSGETFFQNLFIRAKQTAPLMAANRRAQEIFYRRDDPAFMPHLSILYGQHDRSVKSKIIHDIGRRYSAAFDVSLSFDLSAGCPDHECAAVEALVGIDQ